MIAIRSKMQKMNRALLYSSFLDTAKQIQHKAGIHSGNCLEISAGNGLLGIAIAQNSHMHVFLMESSKDMLSKVGANLRVSGLENQNQVRLIKGAPVKIPLGDATMDLVVSRSSIFFWQNRVKTFQEIYRVLTPGGMACIGGGFWNEEIKRQVEGKLEEYNPKLLGQLSGYIWRQSAESLASQMIEAGINSYEMNCGDDGLWIFIKKSMTKQVVS